MQPTVTKSFNNVSVSETYREIFENLAFMTATFIPVSVMNTLKVTGDKSVENITKVTFSRFECESTEQFVFLCV